MGEESFPRHTQAELSGPGFCRFSKGELLSLLMYAIISIILNLWLLKVQWNDEWKDDQYTYTMNTCGKWVAASEGLDVWRWNASVELQTFCCSQGSQQLWKLNPTQPNSSQHNKQNMTALHGLQCLIYFPLHSTLYTCKGPAITTHPSCNKSLSYLDSSSLNWFLGSVMHNTLNWPHLWTLWSLWDIKMPALTL